MSLATTTSAAVQACSNQTSNMLSNWQCSWDKSNTAPYQHAGHAVGGAVKSPGGGAAAIILVLLVIAVIAWMVSTKGNRKTATS